MSAHAPTAKEWSFPRLHAAEQTSELFVSRTSHLYFGILRTGVVVVGLAAGHPIRTSSATISALEFMPLFSNIKVTGKRKRDAKSVRPTSVVCNVTLSDGSQHEIAVGCSGKLLEANTKLIETPSMLSDDRADFEGFLCIVLINTNTRRALLSQLVPMAEYQAQLAAGGGGNEDDEDGDGDGDVAMQPTQPSGKVQ